MIPIEQERPRYRLYIDEVGTANREKIERPEDDTRRYFSLTGVIVATEHAQSWLAPSLERLKVLHIDRHDCDDPVILHRKEIVNARPPFDCLRDPERRTAFDQNLLSLLEELEFTVITAALDKGAHWKRYRVWHYNPYHYCLEILLERYALFLERRGAGGDVLAESRGAKEDKQLKRAFSDLITAGNKFVKSEVFTGYLTSKEIKLKRKEHNVAGLQVADLIAHPALIGSLASAGRNLRLRGFGAAIYGLLSRTKFDRNPRSGKIDGWGRKLIL